LITSYTTAKRDEKYAANEYSKKSENKFDIYTHSTLDYQRIGTDKRRKDLDET
jgi:hypothetical protein